MEPRLKGLVTFWYNSRRKYGGEGVLFFAKHPTPEGMPKGAGRGPRPIDIGHAFSTVFKRGTRHWAFKTEERRDAFVRDWPLAEVCEDPVHRGGVLKK